MPPNEVEPKLLDSFVGHAHDLVAMLESGGDIDLTALAQGMGSTLEYMLCELFSRHAATRALWVDGVILRTPSMRSDRSIFATGYAWCADHRQQWQVPVHVHFLLSEGQDHGIDFLRIRIGDARLETLAAHRERASIEPHEWLLEFEVGARSI